MQLDFIETDNNVTLLDVVKGQLDSLFQQALNAEDRPTAPDWFSVRALTGPEARALSLTDWAAAQAYEEYLHDRLCQITGETPKYAQGVYSRKDWLTVLEEH